MLTGRDNLKPDLAIVELAIECGSNRTHMSQLLNNEFGASFCSFINRYRIEHSARLLSGQTGQSCKIGEIALISVFNSASTFYRAFTKEKGMMPQQWRQKMRRHETER